MSGCRRAVALAAACLLVGAAGAAHGAPGTYSRLSVVQILSAPQQIVGTLALTSGRYETVGPPRCFLEGSLAGRMGARLRVMGPLFDWVPRASSRVEMWGRVRQDRLGRYLEFFNGRSMNQVHRRPYAMPPMVHGSTVTLVAKLRQVGTGPFVHWVLETENRKTVEVLEVPPGFQPSYGLIVEATGSVRTGGVPPALAGLYIRRIRVLPRPESLPPWC